MPNRDRRTVKRGPSGRERPEPSPARGASRPSQSPAPPMRLRLNLWLESEEGEVLFGAGRLQILEAIREHGSLAAAASALGMSYRGLWAKVRHSEKRLGVRLITARAGRGPASGTSLTPQAMEMMERYRALREHAQAAAQTRFGRLFPRGEPPRN